jgi:hypothetical protein
MKMELEKRVRVSYIMNENNIDIEKNKKRTHRKGKRTGKTGKKCKHIGKEFYETNRKRALMIRSSSRLYSSSVNVTLVLKIKLYVMLIISCG